jgi:hypothetical protein
MSPEQIARVAHEVNRAYCASLGDTSQPVWEDAPDWQQASARAGVAMHLANPDATPEQSHESWLAQKTAEGWTYGEVKDAAKKEHPCFLPYTELPAEQKAKDFLFRGVVHTLKDVQDAPAIDEAALRAKIEAEVRASLPAASAPPVIPVDLTPVRYVGLRDSYRDGAYGTHLTFAKGQTRMVPRPKAMLMLRHPDVYELGDVAHASGAVVVGEQPNKPSQSDEEARILELRDSVQNMTKAAVAEYVKTNFRIDLNPNMMKVDEMRQKAIQLLDQFGAP